MAPRTVFLTALALILLACYVKGVERVTVDAGLRFMNNIIILMKGDRVLLLKDDVEDDVGDRSEMGLPEELHIMAGSGTVDNSQLFFYGSGFYYDLKVGQSLTRMNYTRRSKNKFFGNSGPDAAALMDGKTFFFKGCEMVEQRRWARPIGVRKLGLPCNPDAAWTTADGSGIIVLKGDQIWIWDGVQKAEAPKDFSSMYNMTSWELIPRGSIS